MRDGPRENKASKRKNRLAMIQVYSSWFEVENILQSEFSIWSILGKCYKYIPKCLASKLFIIGQFCGYRMLVARSVWTWKGSIWVAK
jgi:hypothetical protein